MSSESSKHLVHLSEVEPPSNPIRHWERAKRRAPVLTQCIAEGFGTFIYTYVGISSNASYVLGNWLQTPALGGLFQVGMGFGIGIVIAVILCLPTSGGFLNPGFTLYAMLFGKIGFRRGCGLILAEVIGSFLACLMIYVQWHTEFTAVIELLKTKGIYDSVMFTPSGPAGVIAMFPKTGSSLGILFVNEFFCDFILAVVILGAVDPTNPLCPPAVIPWLAGFTYASVIWGFAGPGLNSNMAKDVGGRMAALCLWGTGAGGGGYSAISALASIPASILGGLFYELILADHTRALIPGHIEIFNLQKAAAERAIAIDSYKDDKPPSFSESDRDSKA